MLGAFIGPENRQLLNQLLEGADALNIKTAVNGVMSSAAQLFKFKGTRYDVSGELGQALKDLVSLRTRGEKLTAFLENKPLFTDPSRTADSDALLEHLHDAKSAKAISEGLARYERMANEALKDAQSGGMFGGQAATRSEIIRRIYGNEPPPGGASGQTDLPPREPTGPPSGPKPNDPQGAPAAPGVQPPAGRRPVVLTDERAAAARERLKRKLNNVNLGIDPTVLADVVIIAGNKIEAGLLKYSDYIREMLADLGEQFRPYFKAAYNQVREYTELHALKAGMTSREDVETYEAAQDEAARQGSGRPPGLPAAGQAGGQPQFPGAVRGAGVSRRPGIRVVDEGDLPQPRAIVGSQQYTGPRGHAIDETQRLAINLALTHFEKGGEGFLLGDGTGVGKTGTQLVIAAESVKRTKLPALIITQNKGIIENRFKADAGQFGVPLKDIEFATYTDLTGNKIPKKRYGVVIFDEAHNLKNSTSARHWQAQLVDAQHKVWATATPMDTPLHAAYFLAQLTGKTREEIGQRLGYKIVTRTINGEEREFAELEKGMSWAKVSDNIKVSRNEAVKAGTLIRREYPFYGQAVFRNAPDLSAIAREQQTRIIDYWDRRIERAFSPTARRNLAGQKTLELSRWLEIQKLPHVLAAVTG